MKPSRGLITLLALTAVAFGVAAGWSSWINASAGVCTGGGR